MKRAVAVFTNLTRYENNEPNRKYLKITQALKLLMMTQK